MQIQLSPEFHGNREAAEAEAILRSCVHCGFCTATCPTYQLEGNELDGPRGRIYLIKQVFEGGEASRSTQRHLDRCLTCRNCETTCPSGVRYGRLVDIGRQVVDARVQRPVAERAIRWVLKEGLTSPLVGPAVRLGQLLRPALPGVLKKKLPRRAGARASDWPRTERARKVMLLQGCVQPAMLPNINAATARVLDAAGLQTLVAAEAGCCGALRTHLGDAEGGLADMRRNIDAWWPAIESGAVECIVVNASGCGAVVKEYGEALAHEPAYAERAARISALAKDLSELLPELLPALKDRMSPQAAGRRIAVHTPCTLQHAQRLRGGVEAALVMLGFDVTAPAGDGHLCCGSAGAYSVLQPGIATTLRDRKLSSLGSQEPDVIVSANVGCILHLQSGTAVPVQHWVEVLDQALA
ncbi:glycolate oxidase subunit GlcF [Methylibium sp. Root1272]|uniref:glycolate oxidase subunit GlcF n=1 Tax=Methylibium sp. Root1272 TaxID=1736441 RepID=UPI0006FE8A48|nr:glycolate oxidase subunit GlcF [Methylibium sp. Root1272]KQW66146.1 glycolate oxidase iron-sulfur subunit [Methylibium sp. Root1272]